ncbi:MAG: protein kinase [Acidobacteriota bacterium]
MIRLRKIMPRAGQTTVACSKCGHLNPLSAVTCSACKHFFPDNSASTAFGDAPTIQGDSVASSGADDSSNLAPGTVLAERYQIIQTLGTGGMGSVFKVFDKRLTRVVALKTIHPQLAATPAMLKRFKQELLHAQKITHKNVVRIFDIGEDNGTHFITMDYIEGRTLKDVIVEKGKFPPNEATAIIREVCKGLAAAHERGVIHRDLKPQNIMIEAGANEGERKIVVMDFGIARSAESSGATQTGTLLGTPDYMSPEQARMEEVDARSDIFSLGLIFYELLTGKLAFRGETIVESMFKRTKERAIPPVELDRTIPKDANDIVIRCLEPEREKRYQTVREMVQDLENFDPTKKVKAAHLKSGLRSVARYRNIGIAGVLVLIALVAGFMIRNRFAAPKAAAVHAPVTVLVGDFTNHTGDPVFDGTLEPVVKIALEGAGFITAYDRTQVRNLGLQAITGKLDEQAARQIAVGQGLGVVVTGSLDRKGESYTLAIKATQTVTGNTIRSVEETASSKDQVLFTTTKIASAVRKALGDETSESDQRFAMETLTATSLEAIHDYAVAMNALADGKHEDALGNFSKAVDIDQNFGLAYAGMAIASRNLAKQQDAEKYIKLALGHMDRMTERERYRTRASYYLLLGDQQKCVEEYGTLIEHFPSDAAAHNNLALCWTQLRNMPKALEQVRQAAVVLPKRPLYRFNASVYASYGSDFETGEREARALLELDPTYPTGLNALALAQLGQGKLPEATETFQKLEKISKLGASNSRSGMADLALYEGRFTEAAKILEAGATEDLAAKNSDRAATKFAALAYARLMQGQKGPAVAAAESALAGSKNFKIRFLTGRVLAAAGQTARAHALAMDLAAELQVEPQAYAKLIESEIALAGADPRAAIKAATDANNLLDTWIGRFELGRAYLDAGAFTEADSEFDRCIKRRGEALALFLDESPTYGYLPSVYYYMGRVREGLKSAGFADSYRTFLSIRDKAGEDPMVADARKRTPAANR